MSMNNFLRNLSIVLFLFSFSSPVMSGGDGLVQSNIQKVLLLGSDIVQLCKDESATNKDIVNNKCALFLLGYFQGHAGTISIQSETALARKKDVPIEAVRIAASIDDSVHTELSESTHDRAIVCIDDEQTITEIIPNLVNQLKSDDELLTGRAYYSVALALEQLFPCSERQEKGSE